MEDIKKRLQHYYQEYHKLQHLEIDGNPELEQLIIDNFNNLIIPNIGIIVEIFDEFIRENLAKTPNNFAIFNWVDIIFNPQIYDLVVSTMKNNLDNLDEDDKLIHYLIIKIEIIKMKIYLDLLESNKSNDKLVIIFNSNIKDCKRIINLLYGDLVENHKEFTKAIELVNQLFSSLDK